MVTNVSASNQQAWESWFTGLDYQRGHDLFPAERAVLDRFRADHADKGILDIGVGTGRTTRALHEIAGRYVGVDYSAEMVRRAAQRFPGVDLRRMDARNLSAFSPGTFDSAWFSFNGIDYVSHADRLAVLGQIKRVLKPGGLFYFSTHNRDWSDIASASPAPVLKWTVHPIKLAYRLSRHLRAVRNIGKNRPAVVETPDYAIANDASHDFSLLVYRISVPSQIRQLREAGFEPVAILGDEAESLAPDAAARASATIHVVARA